MRHTAAPHRLLIWLAAAAVAWAVLIGVVLFVPQALAGFGIVGLLLWRKAQRPVGYAMPMTAPSAASVAVDALATVTATVTGPSAPALVRTRDDARELVAHSA